MSVSASLNLRVTSHKGALISSNDMLKFIINGGWNIRKNGKIEYLPLGDGDMFDWKTGELSDKELYELILGKERSGEIIGFIIYWGNMDIGGSVLLHSPNEISISLLINRQKINDNITDVNWYITKILPCFMNDSIRVESWSFSQY